ncbi:MAG TPA: protein kinase, partial [Polyangiaceae bacterium]|nr:protein kinase [Polyangiaceae bacterium]
ALAAGTVIAGKLRVVRLIGSGGMGAVYEVEHELTRHRRALKVLHDRTGKQPGIVERFFREASAAGRIGSAHIAEAYDAGRLDTGEAYLLMELVDGETLEQRLLREGPMSEGELADIIYQACVGMQAAHEAGIVHRDLKPENLIVTSRGGAPFVKILDFGISKFDAERTGNLGITAIGTAMGTPYYMSPEQVRGAASVDALSDVYALGVILYECACGDRPFEAQTLEHLAVLIHEGRPMPLRERRPSLSPEFCAIVHQALAADRAQRFQSVRALAEALSPLRVRTIDTPVPDAMPPRVVIRPSNRPPSSPDEGPASTLVAATQAASDVALAATPGSRSWGRKPRVGVRFAPWLVVGVSLLVAGGLAVGVGRSLLGARRGATLANSAASNSASPRLPALVAQEPSAVSAAAGPSAEPRPVLASPYPSPSARIDGSVVAPPLVPTPKSRVDQIGIAGENPFR